MEIIQPFVKKLALPRLYIYKRAVVPNLFGHRCHTKGRGAGGAAAPGATSKGRKITFEVAQVLRCVKYLRSFDMVWL